MATTTNYGWTTPDDTALVKDGAAAIRTLGTSIDTTTKNLNPSTTLGDIEYRSSTANTNTRLGIGTTGQILTVSGGVPTWATAAGGGKVLQVVQGTTSTAKTTTTSTYTDTGLTATITPSAATSKILILVSQPLWAAPLSGSPTGVDASVRILRDATAILTNPNALVTNMSASSNWEVANVYAAVYLDSPATTSATTYKTQQMSSSANTVQTQRSSSPSQIILLEIGA